MAEKKIHKFIQVNKNTYFTNSFKYKQQLN